MDTFLKTVGGILVVIIGVPLIIIFIGAMGALFGVLVGAIWPGVVGAFMTLFPSTIQFWQLTTMWSLFVSSFAASNLK